SGGGRANDEHRRRRHAASLTRVADALTHLVAGKRLPDGIGKAGYQDHRERAERQDLAGDGVDPGPIREEDDLTRHRARIERIASLGGAGDDFCRGCHIARWRMTSVDAPQPTQEGQQEAVSRATASLRHLTKVERKLTLPTGSDYGRARFLTRCIRACVA